MKVIDLYNDLEILNLSSSQEFIKSWKTYVGNDDLSTLCIKDIMDYDFEKDCFPVIKQALSNKHIIDHAHNNFIDCINEIEKKYIDLFGITEAKLVFYLGLCNGAGWVVETNENQYVLFGAEKIVELRWDSKPKIYSLICHELGHVAQMNLRDNWNESYTDTSEHSIMQLFTEGFAEYVASLLSPFPNSRGEEWTNWCCDNVDNIKKEFLNYLKSGTSTQPFFGDWCSILDHSDLGYFLGYKFVEWMSKSHDLTTIAKLNIHEVKKYSYLFLDH